MQSDGVSPTRPTGRWDPLVEGLQQLRHEAGEPSYAEVARRVSERRAAEGADAHAARVARTTVYDAFRPGRSRVNLPLVREIAAVLGGDDERVRAWVAASREAAPAPLVAPVVEPVVEPEAAPAVAEPTVASGGEPPARGLVAVLLLGCVLVNVAGAAFVEVLELPLFLDMVGTAIAAIALGPWHGVAVGLTSNALAAVGVGWEPLPFGLVNAAGALVWGYGVRRLALGRTLPRFLSLNVLVAVVCTLVAVPLLVLVFGGGAGHEQEDLRDRLLAVTDQLVVAVGFSNLLASVADKVIAGFLALVAVSALPSALLRGCDLVLTGPSARPEKQPPGR